MLTCAQAKGNGWVWFDNTDLYAGRVLGGLLSMLTIKGWAWFDNTDLPSAGLALPTKISAR